MDSSEPDVAARGRALFEQLRAERVHEPPSGEGSSGGEEQLTSSDGPEFGQRAAERLGGAEGAVSVAAPAWEARDIPDAPSFSSADVSPSEPEGATGAGRGGVDGVAVANGGGVADEATATARGGATDAATASVEAVGEGTFSSEAGAEGAGAVASRAGDPAPSQAASVVRADAEGAASQGAASGAVPAGTLLDGGDLSGAGMVYDAPEPAMSETIGDEKATGADPINPTSGAPTFHVERRADGLHHLGASPIATGDDAPDPEVSPSVTDAAAGPETFESTPAPTEDHSTPVIQPSRARHPAADLALPRIVAIANQKGGVGKTTTAVNLGAALAELGFRTLVVDLDPQGNATTGLGINARNLDNSIYDVLMHEMAIDECIEPTSVRNLFVAPATIDLAGAEIELVPAFSREMRLKRALAEVADAYDFTIIDCPPSLGLLTVNGLAAATEVIVPIQCEYYALEGLSQLMRNVNLVQSNLNPALLLSAIILTMYDARTKLADQVATEVRDHFGARVCRNVVPRTVRLSEAPSFGQPIIVFDPSSRGALAYRELAKEVSGGAPQRVG